MGKTRVSSVKYINSYPFIFGINSKLRKESYELITGHPSECAGMLINGQADIGLVPVASIPLIKSPRIISDYCIGTNSPVKTVLLLSNVAFDEITRIWLDYRSMTSVHLVKILAASHWKHKPVWEQTHPGFELKSIGQREGVVLIGDQCFRMETEFTYTYDLATEWKKLTGLPFVFACWVANSNVSDNFINEFEEALEYGVNNIELSVDSFPLPPRLTRAEIIDYLYNNISFPFDDKKREAMEMFLNYK